MIVMTWNMQGAAKSEKTTNIAEVLPLLNKGVDLLLLQEVGSRMDWKLERKTILGVKLRRGLIPVGTSMASVYWYDSKENGAASHDRCSMAVISPHITHLDIIKHRETGTLRPLIGARLSNGLWIYNIHAPATKGHKAASGVAHGLISKRCDLAKEKYACIGDFNCPPAEMQGRGYNVEAADGGTHIAGNTLDYAVYKGLTVMLMNEDALGLPVKMSDHYSQVFKVL
jgi:endonuclease/exonuclease/phosphatase family metal-dependent hydrolase